MHVCVYVSVFMYRCNLQELGREEMGKEYVSGVPPRER